MPYIEGFLVPVRKARKDEYIAFAQKAWPMFQEFGMTRQVECWGDDLMRGERTDFLKAVQAEDGETVVFSWLEYPDKATRDAANEKMMADPRFEEMGEMPFDGKRMIFSGFVPVFDSAGTLT